MQTGRSHKKNKVFAHLQITRDFKDLFYQTLNLGTHLVFLRTSKHFKLNIKMVIYIELVYMRKFCPYNKDM
ncbi:hypothetical protein DR864_09485 [Runella rosea]|uniref:Uncharacterized protein n=1 Tax=Runella rosea TaxID=2259595 RepID=A0A344TH29_9BACT|nr:hypothetical protein DR864_09485 [Runella rosea]